MRRPSRVINLNQTAHRDRQFGSMQTRLGVGRKTRRATSATPRWSTAWLCGHGGLWPGRCAQPQARPVRRQHARRTGATTGPAIPTQTCG